jgi:hypothetical protein
MYFYFYCSRPYLIEKQKFNRELSSRFWVPIIKPYVLLLFSDFLYGTREQVEWARKQIKTEHI